MTRKGQEHRARGGIIGGGSVGISTAALHMPATVG
jgi:hypothetical protein